MPGAEIAGEAAVEGCRGVIQTLDGDPFSVVFVLGDDRIERSDRGAIPDVRSAHVNDHGFGVRNVQGLGWAADGTMYASEFGQNTWDELNIITPGGN